MGFTLAEVLITLAIIGIVAALTIPGLIQTYQEKVTVNKLVTVYARLLESVKVMVYENGTIDTYGSTNREMTIKLTQLLPQYVKGLSVCTNVSSCAPATYTRRDGGTSHRGGYYFKMLDGTVISIVNRASGVGCLQDMSLTQRIPGNVWANGTAGGLACGEIIVDLNGVNAPNVFDVDIFLFKIVKDGIVPAGSIKEKYWHETFEDQCMLKNPYYSGGYCAAWIIANKNMDYLHCDDLSWEGKRKCRQ